MGAERMEIDFVGTGDTQHVPSGDEVTELAVIIGNNLRELRTKRGLSLEALARLSGVSRAMISQIEGGRSMPTIGVLWKITAAFGVPFSTLMGTPVARELTVMTADDAKLLTSRTGKFSSRALFPHGGERRVEFYELVLQPFSREDADAHPPGTTENLIVTQGEVEIAVGRQQRVIRPGDAAFFQADLPHSYRNVGRQEAIMYLVMTYAQPVG